MRNQDQIRKMEAVNKAARNVVAHSDAAVMALRTEKPLRAEALIADVNYWVDKTADENKPDLLVRMQGLFIAQRPDMQAEDIELVA